MSRSARWFLIAAVLFLIVALVAVILVLSTFSGGLGITPQKERVLVIRLDQAVPEVRPQDPLSQLLGGDTADFREILDALEKARTDDRIEGLLVDSRGGTLGAAQSEELRAAIHRFRESGEKWSIAYFETAGEFGGATSAYYVATACEEIVLAPPGDLWLTGLSVESPFLRGMFDKLEIEPQFGQRKEFKNAANMYTHASFTKAHKEALDALLDAIYGEIVTAVATGREMTPERVRELIDGAPYIAPEALEAGLVDRLAYWDELVDDVEERTGKERPFIGVKRYIARKRPHASGKHRIALIYGVGAVVRGESGSDPLAGDVMGSDTLTRALREARENDAIDAVVLRVDSPGGSYVASDLIRREVVLTKAEKPVVVSMGNVAASGGYFVAMQADRIFADENTITGSIGVLFGKLVTRQFWNDKTGISFGTLKRGRNADFMSSQSGWDARAQERVDTLLDRIYEDFVGKAAEGRSMTYDDLEPLAHGRVWAGSDARELGLIDEIGGLTDAIDAARQMAGIEDDAAFRIVVLPKPPTLLESLGQKRETLTTLTPEMREAILALRAVVEADREHVLLDPSIPTIR